MKYTKELLESVIRDSSSMSEVIRKLGNRTNNGFVTYLSKRAKKFGIDTSHFKTKSRQISDYYYRKYPLEDYLSGAREIGSSSLKQKLVRAKLKEDKCEECGLAEWKGIRISLHLHHIDENHENNKLDNLMILCPNCHSYYHNKDKKRKKIAKGNKIAATLHKDQRKVVRPSYTSLIQTTSEIGFSATGRMYGVSDNAIRKWIKMYEKYDQTE
jgi:5-methylcytosine-specific restriction endonuclease McrA